MMPDEKIKNSREQEFAVFCIENVEAKLDVGAERVYQLIRDGVSDMHCMSDAYLAEELEQEYSQNNANGINTADKMPADRRESAGKLPVV